MLPPNQGVGIAFDRGFEAFVGRENQRTGRVPIERVRSKTDRDVQEGELFGLPRSLCFELIFEPPDDLDDRTGTGSVEPHDERTLIPAPPDVFAAEPAVDQPAQVSSQAPRFDMIEAIEARRLDEAERIRSSVPLSGRQTGFERRSRRHTREQARLTTAQLLPAKSGHPFGFAMQINQPARREVESLGDLGLPCERRVIEAT